MTVRVRFAPSPTGWLHVGNVRTALVNWLFARRHGGEFLLRIDDTDAERSRPEYAAGIEEDLRWLGMTWDLFARQSDRFDRYEAARARLIAAGRLYPCYETPDELEVRRKFQLSAGKPPIYDRAALALSDADRARLEAEGRKPHYRFLLGDEEVTWDDHVRGHTAFAGRSASDPVLVRADGVPTYTLSSTVDDAELGITDVIRGEDHVSNTAVQIQIFRALGVEPPRFGHLALIKTAEGGLSKREGGHDIRSLRTDGIEPMAINSTLARLGTSAPVEPFADLGALAAAFDLSLFGRAPATYDPEALAAFNAQVLAVLPYAAVKERLAGEPGEAFWLAVRGNLCTLADAADWWRVCTGEIESVREDPELLAQAATLLPPEPWDETTWKTWASAVSQTTGRKGKALFHPLRLALTGREQGPEMAKLLPLIGRERAAARLKG